MKVHPKSTLEIKPVYTTAYKLPQIGKKGKEFWGGPTWISWHSIAAVYEPENRTAAKSYTYSLTKLLPCKLCRAELLKTLTEIKIDDYLGSAEDFFRFTYICHD